MVANTAMVDSTRARIVRRTRGDDGPERDAAGHRLTTLPTRVGPPKACTNQPAAPNAASSAIAETPCTIDCAPAYESRGTVIGTVERNAARKNGTMQPDRTPTA